tara:strand:- start:354 stop:971 length:618 start_codon:yes stop_codon:yes gene_type:complete
MEFKEYSEPSPHIIIDNFLTSEEYNKVRKEINDLIPKMNVGVMKSDTGHEKVLKDVKNNLNIWLDMYYSDRSMSNILNYITKIWDSEISDYLQKADNGIFRLYNITNNDSTLLSAYGNGQFYKEHTDGSSAVLTNLFISSTLLIGNNFKGGDFVLGNKTIPFKDNRLIMFESHRLHQVTAVETDENSDNWRYSIQYFAGLKKGGA